MQAPQPRGTPTDNARYEHWIAPFSGYIVEVTRQKLELWIQQFAAPDRDLAARLLDAVLFFGHAHIRTTFRELLAGLPGWSDSPENRAGRWFFVPFSGSVGESGDSMMHAFRMATGMTQNKFKHLFVHRSELVSLRPGAMDTVVLIDDFSGTGTQAIRAWREVFAEILTEEPKVVLLLVAATRIAVDVINDNTEMQLVCGTLFDEHHNLFSEACLHFSVQEKHTIERYCKRANRQIPHGSGDSGLLVVFAHRCPNNSLPILHANHPRWRGIFPRDLS